MFKPQPTLSRQFHIRGIAHAGRRHHVAPVLSAPPSGQPLEAPTPEASDAELKAYIRKNILRGLLVLALLFVAIAIVGRVYRQELDAATGWLFQTMGLPGLGGLLFLSDAVLSPVPPDALLLILARSPLAAKWWFYVPLLGAVSAVAGVIGSLLGRRLHHTRFAQVLFGAMRGKTEILVKRYGRWGVALGALTPIPFSVTCWTAGMLRMSLRELVPMALLRIPRFIIYYWIIAHSVGAAG